MNCFFPWDNNKPHLEKEQQLKVEWAFIFIIVIIKPS